MANKYLDLTGLQNLVNKIKSAFVSKSGDTMTGQLKTSFKGSVAPGSLSASSTTIPDLCEELRYSSGCCGSCNITTAYTKNGYTIPARWYNFIWVPHRSGGANGAASGDNCDYGALYLTGMNGGYGFIWFINYSNKAIQSLIQLNPITSISPEILTSGYVNIHPENSPVLIPFMHNDIAHLLKRGGSAVLYHDGAEASKDMTPLFDGSGSYFSYNATAMADITEIVIELTCHKTFIYSNWIYVDFGNVGWRAKNVKIEVMNSTSSYPNDVWTQKYNTTTNASGHIAFNTSHTPVGASNSGGGFNKIRFTFSNFNTTQFRISQLGVYNYGSAGLRETYMSRGIDDFVFRNITPNGNNTYSLGSSSNKWANVYATTLNGTTIPSSPKFTDTVTTATTTGSGNAVTAITASNGALTVTKGATFLTSHQDISGKADKSATVSTVTWDSTNKKLTKTINGTTTDVVTGATILNGLTKAQVTTALGYTPPTTDTDTVTTATTTGSGNAVTAITASNGALTVTKGATFMTQAQVQTMIDTAIANITDGNEVAY